MNNKLSTKGVIASLAIGVLALTTGVQAETNSNAVGKQKMAIEAKSMAQFGFSNNLFFGLRGNADVMELQEFLTDQGFYSGPVTGNYFLLTAQGVKKFQSANGVNPTGFFGPLTRGKANVILEKLLGGICQNETGCDGTIWPAQQLKIIANSGLNGAVGKEFVAHFKVRGGNGNYNIQSSGDIPGLSWTPTYCPSLFGREVACAQVVSPDTITLYGTPKQAGKYDVTITATESVPAIYCIMAPCPQPVGRTAKASFTIVIDGDANNAGAPIIKSVSGPTKLNAGATGTWNVNAYDSGNGNLSYSVNWGDEANYATEKVNAQGASSVYVQTATFSHAYQNQGTYKVTFRVTNSSGKTAETSMTVTVGSEGKVSLAYLKPDYGSVGTSVTIVGSGFTATGNKIRFGNQGTENNPVYNVNSYDGTTLTFMVPYSQYISCRHPIWPNDTICMVMETTTNPGAYSVSVTNSTGISNELAFQVTR